MGSKKENAIVQLFVEKLDKKLMDIANKSSMVGLTFDHIRSVINDVETEILKNYSEVAAAVLFNMNCKKNIKEWNGKKFKKEFKTLYKSIIDSIVIANMSDEWI